MSNKASKTEKKINKKLVKSLVKASTAPKKPKASKTPEAPKLYREVPNSPVVLGRTYTECVHGISGVATMYAVHLTGCDRVLLSRPKDKSTNFSHLDEIWTDVTTLLGDDNQFVVPQETVKDAGHCGDHASGDILGTPPR